MAPKAATQKAVAAKKAVVKGVHGKKVTKVRTSATFHRPKTLRLPRAPKYQRKSIAHAPRLDKYKVIVGPYSNESTMKKLEDDNTIVFIVDIKANKRHIKDAIKGLYNAEVSKVTTLITPTGQKKAYIKLSSESETLDVANRAGFI
ncbi:ribosomal protein L23, N-terminal domain-containing protein [Lipomyces japonicus]|uniref:60S ribosomal protein uL23 n=1 Tax=Lipomyces japonicus TaxID=56871 RepID=UPI0034CFB631